MNREERKNLYLLNRIYNISLIIFSILTISLLITTIYLPISISKSYSIIIFSIYMFVMSYLLRYFNNEKLNKYKSTLHNKRLIFQLKRIEKCVKSGDINKALLIYSYFFNKKHNSFYYYVNGYLNLALDINKFKNKNVKHTINITDIF